MYVPFQWCACMYDNLKKTWCSIIQSQVVAHGRYDIMPGKVVNHLVY
jgi:hypothetical protein